MKEAENQHHRIEEKLLEAEKGKQDLEEQNRRVQASLEEQVFLIIFNDSTLLMRY